LISKMANVNIYVAGVVAGAVANRRRAPNLLRVACVNEEGEHIINEAQCSSKP